MKNLNWAARLQIDVIGFVFVIVALWLTDAPGWAYALAVYCSYYPRLPISCDIAELQSNLPTLIEKAKEQKHDRAAE